MAPLRRTTLGPVTNNGLNARPSLSSMRPPKPTRSAANDLDDRRFGRRATSTAILASATKSDVRRGSRPSMSYGGSNTRRADPRPLHDKQYMQQCVKSLISYVIDHGYEHPISPKILTNPSSRDFQNIFLFLLRRVDPTFEFQRRFEDEVPVVLKALHYPFSMSKSALSAVGSPHTWPTLLGVLTWLMGLLKYGDAKQEKEAAASVASSSSAVSVLSPEERRQQLFHNNMVSAYKQFLLGADDYPELDRELRAHFEGEKTRRDTEIAKLQADRNQLNATLHTLQTQPSPLQLALDHRTSLETNIHKFQLLIPSLLEHNQSVLAKTREKEKELMVEEEELALLLGEKAELEKALANQEEAGIDSERIGAEREQLREDLRKLAAQRAQVERDQREIERLLADAFYVLDDNVKKYHALVGKLVKVGNSSTLDPKKVDWELVVSRRDGATEANSILSKQVDNEVLSPLRKLKEEISKMVPLLQEDVLRFQDKIDEVEEQLIVLRNDQSVLESRKQQLEDEYHAKRTAMSEQLQARSKAVLEREGQMAKALNERRDELHSTEQTLKLVTDKLGTLREELTKKRRVLEAIAERELELARRHHDAVKDSWNTIVDHFKDESQM